PNHAAWYPPGLEVGALGRVVTPLSRPSVAAGKVARILGEACRRETVKYPHDEKTPDRTRVRRAHRGRDPPARAGGPDRPEAARGRGAARLGGPLRPPRPGGPRPRLRQRPLPARQRRLAARPRPPGRRCPARGDPLRHAPRQSARAGQPALRG